MRTLDHLGESDEVVTGLYDQTARFFFTLYPSRYGLREKQQTEEQQDDQDGSVAEVIVANRDRISEERWFGDAEPQVWVALIALDYLEDSLLSRRVIKNPIARGDVEELGELENAKISVASHMNARCFETAEILTVADCLVREKMTQQAKAKKGARKRHEQSYKAIRGFIEFYAS